MIWRGDLRRRRGNKVLLTLRPTMRRIRSTANYERDRYQDVRNGKVVLPLASIKILISQYVIRLSGMICPFYAVNRLMTCSNICV